MKGLRLCNVPAVLHNSLKFSEILAETEKNASSQSS